MENIKLIQGDCLEELRKLENNSINLVLIDPPYNIGKSKEWDKWEKVSKYVEFMGEVFKEVERVLKPSGSFYFFHNDFLQIVELQNYINNNTNFIFNSFIIWNKPNHRTFIWKNPSEKNNLRSWFNVCEYCLAYNFKDRTALSNIHDHPDCFREIKDYLKAEKKKSGKSNKEISLMFSEYFNKEGCRDRSVIEHYFSNSQWVLPTEEIYNNILQATGYFKKPFKELREEYERELKKQEELYKKYEQERYTHNLDENHHNVWVSTEKMGNRLHICQKPTDILERIIKTSSNVGDVVLDCFMGSGSTGVAALNTGRKFIGIEKDAKYYEIAKNRIKERINKIDI